MATQLLGDLPTARAYLEANLEYYRTVGNRWRIAFTLSSLGYNHFQAGDHAAARRHLSECVAIFAELGEPDSIGFPRRFLAHIAAARGEHAEAWRLAAASVESNRRAGDRLGTASSAAALVSVLTARGLLGEAARLAGVVAAELERLGLATMTAGDKERYEGAVRSVRAALGEPAFAAAWSEGQTLSLDEALAGALEPPASESPPASPMAGPAAGLSPRELEVLRLLAAGKSNPEIAEELVISVHTVIRHANHIFAKLGVQNRVEAATYAQRHGLV
jgi:non-specific serine/threonine protein kinase